jgi:hypothetical protein
LRAVRAVSTLEDELKSPRLEVWLVDIASAVAARAASTLDDEMEKEFELSLTAKIASPTLEDELLRLKLDV